MLYCSIIFCIFVLSTNIYQIESSTATDDIAEETQHAVCKILTREIQTTANATITRQLKGVCTTKYMEMKLKQLEIRLFNELNEIKTALGLNISERSHFKKQFEIINDRKSLDYNDYSQVNDEELMNEFSRDENNRNMEIMQYNDTIQIINNENVFIYYWRIDSINSLLKKVGIYVKSPEINVLGHQLYIQLYPNHLGTHFIGIQLRPTTNFFKKYKITVLDQFERKYDIESELLGGINSQPMYQLWNQNLYKSQYLYNNSVILKVMIFLNS